MPPLLPPEAVPLGDTEETSPLERTVFSGSSASRPAFQENIPVDGVGTAGCWPGRPAMWERSLGGSLPCSSSKRLSCVGWSPSRVSGVPSARALIFREGLKADKIHKS